MDKVVNQTELAVLHGVTDVTIWQWQKEGMPIAKVNTRGLSNEYDVASTIEWRVARAEKKIRDESPRDALARAQTKLAEQLFAEKARELVPVAELEPGLVRMVVLARQQLLQIIGLMRSVLDPAQLQLLEEHLRQALKDLSRYDPSHATAEADREPLAATDETIRGGLGGIEEVPERQDAVPGPVPARADAVPA